MNNSFKNIVVINNGFCGENSGCQFSARFDLFLIRQAWNRGVNFEDLADGFGKGFGTMGGDWSGIRDSSLEATNQMFERALNFFFSK
jgi:hypothetical protein